MISKLTLTVEEKVIRKAKSYAHKNGKSLSKIVEHYLENLTEAGEEKKEMPGSLRKLYGAVKIPSSLEHKKEIRRIMKTKYE